jgi:uncharacterized membrane protein
MPQPKRNAKATPSARRRPARRLTAGAAGTGPNGRSQAAGNHPIRRNVSNVAAMEQELLAHRSTLARASERVAAFAGTPKFVLLHVTGFAAWIGWNSGFVPGLRRFDPYPFTFLTFVVSLEAILLSTFVLITQKRITEQSERRAQLDLQINLLAEQESTKTLRMLLRIGERLGIDVQDEEARLLMKETRPKEVVRDIEQKIPNDKR